MIEIPEAVTITDQMQCIIGKKITNVIAGQTPHKFAWFSGDPGGYPVKLKSKSITAARPAGGIIEIVVEDMIIALSEGLTFKYSENKNDIPKKHQLLLTFEDESFLSVSIRMYGGLLCAKENEIDNEYYLAAKERPSPLNSEFNDQYFAKLIEDDELLKLSTKALLATKQRIPGLGNGVLQDILFNAHIHPKKKVLKLTDQDKTNIYKSIKTTLADMTIKGGRDTEKDFYGNVGKYRTILSRNTVNQPCPACGSPIQKASYMGGSIYFCSTCQRL